VRHSRASLDVALLAALILTACQPGPPQAQGPPPEMPVTVATASTQPAPLEVSVVGAVEPSAKVEIKSQIAGQLTAVHFAEGQNVNQGDLLFEVDPQPFQQALRQTEAALERSRAQLAQAESAVQRDRVQLKSAEADAARYDTLAKERIVAAQLALQYRTAAESLKETLRLDQAAIASARASLKVDEAAIEKSKLELSYCRIRAPWSGRAGNLLVHPGNLLKINDVPLVVLHRVSPAFVTFNVSDKHVESIRRFSALRKLPVQITSRDNAAGKTTGYLSVVDNTVDTQTGTIRLKATVENANRLLWPGQFVDVVLTLDTTQVATVVPSEAVQAGQQGQLVYVVKADKSVEPRVVSTGRTIARNIIIENGIAPGEVVVTDGQMLLFPGAKVKVVTAPPPAGGIH
jgi:membrane fusion protein, multidrug efflux system